MVHLFVPPSVRRFSPERVVPSPFSRYLALEYDLLESVRPRLVVDLGTGDAVSYFTYCQSMRDHDVDGVCYGIDTWEESPDTHPQATFESINAHARRFYPGLTYLVRMRPPEARRQFDEGSIDLLRIDGTRPDVAPGADVEFWYRCVRPGGVIVWHGVEAAPNLFSLIASRVPSATFTDGKVGVGLARKPGPEPSAQLLRLLFVENESAELERFYRQVHEHLSLSRVLAAVQSAR